MKSRVAKGIIEFNIVKVFFRYIIQKPQTNEKQETRASNDTYLSFTLGMKDRIGFKSNVLTSSSYRIHLSDL